MSIGFLSKQIFIFPTQWGTFFVRVTCLKCGWHLLIRLPYFFALERSVKLIQHQGTVETFNTRILIKNKTRKPLNFNYSCYKNDARSFQKYSFFLVLSFVCHFGWKMSQISLVSYGFFLWMLNSLTAQDANISKIFLLPNSICS